MLIDEQTCGDMDGVRDIQQRDSEHCADTLTLELQVNDVESESSVIEPFAVMMAALTVKILGLESAPEFASLAQSGNADVTIDGYRIRLTKEEWNRANVKSYEQHLIIAHPAKPAGRIES